MRGFARILIAVGLLAVLSPASAQTPDVQAIVDRASATAYYQGEDGKARVEMAITDAQGALASEGVGVEPASAASVAGLRKLLAAGVVDSDEDVVCLTTGHLLKDPDAAAAAGTEPEPVPADTEGVLDHLRE